MKMLASKNSFHMKKNHIRNIGLLIFFFFVFTVDFRTNIFGNVYIAYFFAIVSLLMIFYGSYLRAKNFVSIPIIIGLWLISIIFIIPSGSISVIIKYIIGLFLLWLYANSSINFRFTVKALSVIGLIFTFFTYFFYWFPDIFMDNVVPYLEDYLQTQVITMMRNSQYVGLTGHYSTNGTYLAIGLGATFAWLMTSQTKRSRIILGILALSILGALLLIGKRAHLIFSFISCLIVYWTYYSNRKLSRLVKSIALILSLVLLFIIFVNFFPALNNTLSRFFSTAEEGDFMMNRDVFYAKAWETFLAHPIFGIGWGKMKSIIDHDVHNVYIQLLAETGIVGTLLFIVLIAFGLISSIKTAHEFVKRKNNELAQQNCLIWFALFYMIFFCLYCLTGNPLYDEQPFYIYMISYGIVLQYRRVYGTERVYVEHCEVQMYEKNISANIS